MSRPPRVEHTGDPDRMPVVLRLEGFGPFRPHLRFVASVEVYGEVDGAVCAVWAVSAMVAAPFRVGGVSLHEVRLSLQ